MTFFQAVTKQSHATTGKEAYMSQETYLQQIFGTDKRNPAFTICRNKATNVLHVFYGSELLEIDLSVVALGCQGAKTQEYGHIPRSRNADRRDATAVKALCSTFLFSSAERPGSLIRDQR